MTKTQQIAAGLGVLGWKKDPNSRSTKGVAWMGGTIPLKGAVPLATPVETARVYTGPGGSCRLSLAGKKTESTPMTERTVAAIIAAGEVE
jgi:hypothetical protein